MRQCYYIKSTWISDLAKKLLNDLLLESTMYIKITIVFTVPSLLIYYTRTINIKNLNRKEKFTSILSLFCIDIKWNKEKQWKQPTKFLRGARCNRGRYCNCYTEFCGLCYLDASCACCAYCCALQVGRENGLTLKGDDTRPLIPVKR